MRVSQLLHTMDKDDLIIIDDAHLFSANEYGDFIYGNQNHN